MNEFKLKKKWLFWTIWGLVFGPVFWTMATNDPDWTVVVISIGLIIGVFPILYVDWLQTEWYAEKWNCSHTDTVLIRNHIREEWHKGTYGNISLNDALLQHGSTVNVEQLRNLEFEDY